MTTTLKSDEEQYDGPPRTPDEWLDVHVSGVIQDVYWNLKEDLKGRGFHDILDRLELSDFMDLAVNFSSSCPGQRPTLYEGRRRPRSPAEARACCASLGAATRAAR